MAVPFALRVSTADSASRRPSLKMTGARSDAIRNLQTKIYRIVQCAVDILRTQALRMYPFPCFSGLISGGVGMDIERSFLENYRVKRCIDYKT